MDGLMMDYPLVVTRVLERARRMFPEKEIVSWLADGSWHRQTYADAYQRVVRLANALTNDGIGEGSVVGVFAWNHHAFFELYHALPGLGAVLNSLNTRLSADQLAFIIDHAGCEIVFLDADLAARLEPLRARLGKVRRWIVIGSPDEAQGFSDATSYETFLSTGDDTPRFPELDERTAAVLCYTSGTTGDPKGVLYSHRSLFLHAMGAQMIDSGGLCEASVVLPIVPLFHASGWGYPFSCAMAGSKLVLPGPHVDAKSIAELIERERVTFAAAVPTVWLLMLQHLKREARDISSLDLLLVGGAASPPAMIEAYERQYGVRVRQAWGMTETSPVGTISYVKSSSPANAPGADAERYVQLSRQGYAVPCVDVRVEDDGGGELPWDGTSVGELVVRGPWVAKAYFRSDATASFTEDGWFRTGDMVTIDASGCVTVCDRKKDLIKTRGEWISSVAMENAAVALDGVVEAAVVGRPDELRDEAPVLYVVLEEARELEPDALVSGLAESFERWQLPKTADVHRLEAIPKTSTGKIDKKLLRKRLV